jgi:hypothetical protein
MMTPSDTRNLLAALTTADYQFVGVRPADATPKESPCIILDGRTANALSYAMVAAGQAWPECTNWALIGSDQQIAIRSPHETPLMHALRQPATLTTFTTTA